MTRRRKRSISRGIFKSPELAARVVNAYVEELHKFINANAFTTAEHNSCTSIEGQLPENKTELSEAGKEINDFYRKINVSLPAPRRKVDVAHWP